MQETIAYLQSQLKDQYDPREIQSFAKIILKHLKDWDMTAFMLNQSTKLDKETKDEIINITHLLKQGKPIQYILGYTEFFDLTFRVNENVLIPRPETEELIQMILNKHKNIPVNILDIGTGSGCIPITLAKHLPLATVHTTDISTDAIATAKQNALDNQVDVTFYNRDILSWEKFNWEQYDIIVSNPPYVKESEKALMRENVLKFEPHLALFVADSDPLIFYRRIAEMALKVLNPNGKLYFEINEAHGDELAETLSQLGFKNIQILEDLYGKQRMCSCEKVIKD
ncbi:peptide chain release factor N(5)-glutamine methyltransferase [Puteibacter caeruleilacunae]|nr:peptide chain release factor N(5)-glutamine methyltransferase [Puteibacter caeruleilacunae]